MSVSQPASLGAPAAIADVRYEVTFDSAHAAARRVGVRMTFTARGRGPVVLTLPAWTPGAYAIRYFARQLSDFAATGPRRAAAGVGQGRLPDVARAAGRPGAGDGRLRGPRRPARRRRELVAPRLPLLQRHQPVPLSGGAAARPLPGHRARPHRAGLARRDRHDAGRGA